MFEDHAAYVYHSLRRLGVRPSDLEDLTQEVFLQVYRKFDSYDPTRPTKPWLFAFAARVAANHRRLSKHEHEVVTDDAPVIVLKQTPEDRAEYADVRNKIATTLDGLSDEVRQAFVLHDVDGLAGPEIADALAIPVNTVYSRVRLAREALARALRHDYAPLAKKGGRR
ncbi:MAG: RNA polymerase sigma factor [Myxococcota bacterium]